MLQTSKRKQRQAAAKRPLKAKVVVLGDSASGVGKTSILLRHDGQGFTSLMSSTLGASYVCSKSIHGGGREVELQIWDTAGQERFRSMVPLYLRGAVAAVLVYDITNKHSFHGVESWIDEVARSEGGADVALFVMANKADLDKNRCVSEREGRELAEKKGAHYFETSALNGKGIESAMVLIAEGVLHRNIAAKSSTLTANNDDQPGVSSSPGIHLHTSPWTSQRSRKPSAASTNVESDEDDDDVGSRSGISQRRRRRNSNQGHKSAGSGFGGCCGIF